MSAALQWMIIRDSSSFIMKRKNIRSFSHEKNNLKGINSFRYNGLIHKKSIDVQPTKDGKGVVLITKRPTKSRTPAKAFKKSDLKKNPRRTFRSIRRVIKNNKYRKDLKMAALRKASAILKSQKPVILKKVRGEKKKE